MSRKSQEQVRIDDEEFSFSERYRERKTTKQQLDKAIQSVGRVHGCPHSYEVVKAEAVERLKQFGYIMTKDLHADLGWDDRTKADVDAAKIYSFLLVDFDMNEYRGRRSRRVALVPKGLSGLF